MSGDLVQVAEEAVPGIHRVQLEYRPIKSVNVFVVPDDDGLTLVDSGPIPEEYLGAVDEALHRSGLGGLEAVHSILLTHAHTDHIGQASRIQRLSGARCVLDPEGVDFASARYGAAQGEELLRWFTRHGLPDTMLAVVGESLPRTPDIPDIVPFPAMIEAAGTTWEVLRTGGHAPGHVVLHSPDLGVAFVGDAVLENIVPLIDVQPFRPTGIVGQYLAELRSLRSLDDPIVLPGHGPAFRGLSDRVDALIKRHEDRMTRILETCRSAPSSAYDLSLTVFGASHHGIVRMRMAFGQTIGYVNHLAEEGLLEQVDAGTALTWSAA